MIFNSQEVHRIRRIDSLREKWDKVAVSLFITYIKMQKNSTTIIFFKDKWKIRCNLLIRYLKLISSFANFQHKLFTACNSVIRLINMISLQLNYCPLVNPLLGAWASVSLWWKYGINGFPHLRNIRRFSTLNRPKFICCQYLQHFVIKGIY